MGEGTVACSSVLEKNYCLKLIMISFINYLFPYQFLRFGILFEAYLILMCLLNYLSIALTS